MAGRAQAVDPFAWPQDLDPYPMSRFPLVLLASGAIVGGAMLWGRYDLSQLGDLRVRPRAQTSESLALPGGQGAIRVAAYRLKGFGDEELANPDVVRTLCQVLRQFDVVALQDIRSRSQDILPRLVGALNATGAAYDFVIGPRVGRGSDVEQYAFVFNTATVEIDPRTFYTVNDPDDLVERDPLVAAFRARQGAADEAFTFTAINVRVDPDNLENELAVLDDILAAVHQDGRQEDDLIVLGDLGVDESGLGAITGSRGLYAAIFPTPSQPQVGTSNLLFSRRATSEFTGSAGMFDLVRRMNLTSAQAEAVSPHLPVWAEFDVREGGKPGRVALR